MKLILLLTLAVTFKLGMTLKEATKECPKPLDVKQTRDVNFACDDGKKTTVLVFDNGKLAGILDISYFAKEHAF